MREIMKMLIYFCLKSTQLETIWWTLFSNLEITIKGFFIFLQNFNVQFVKFLLFKLFLFWHNFLAHEEKGKILLSLLITVRSVWMFWYDRFNTVGSYTEGDENQANISPLFFCTFLTTPWFGLMSLEVSCCLLLDLVGQWVDLKPV